ncbi:unnamed protein product [Pseudo-nitzschia multistriata]|uniref:Catechol O-methyltransferase n=1 Tax=Pseudo-nitzschia multistriata TaxID=183589 RepID=A0A448ZL40_9STRA|nr:unnamed protein product [Pseudo-nitzschia multistriata]
MATSNNIGDDDDDPFACFDSSDDEDEDRRQEIVGKLQDHTLDISRDPGNGVLAFHAGTEVALLHYVKTELDATGKSNTMVRDEENTNTERAPESAISEQARTILGLVDSYCLSRHWMMHVGPEKAGPLRDFISKCLGSRKRKNSNDHGSDAVVVVELGTYCGYSSIFIAKTILEYHRDSMAAEANTGVNQQEDSDRDDPLFHIYSVEVVEGFARVARELIQLAGMEAYITVILAQHPDDAIPGKIGGPKTNAGEAPPSLSSELMQRLPRGSEHDGESTVTTTKPIDFLFVDHDKSLYLPHLRELENTGFIREGTFVAADNVVFAQIDDYRDYMSRLAEQGIVETRLEDSLMVEYCEPELRSPDESLEHNKGETTTTKEMLQDGIEFSIYLTDPARLPDS